MFKDITETPSLPKEREGVSSEATDGRVAVTVVRYTLRDHNLQGLPTVQQAAGKQAFQKGRSAE